MKEPEEEHIGRKAVAREEERLARIEDRQFQEREITKTSWGGGSLKGKKKNKRNQIGAQGLDHHERKKI